MTAKEWFDARPIVDVCTNFLKLGIPEKDFKPKRTRKRKRKRGKG